MKINKEKSGALASAFKNVLENTLLIDRNQSNKTKSA
jgi:hypothetical protein